MQWENFSRHQKEIEAFPHLSSVTLSSFAAWVDRESGQGRGKHKRQEGKGEEEGDCGRIDEEMG